MLNKMLNKQFMYGTHIVTILDYDINDEKERFYLYTDRKTEAYDRPIDSAISFLNEFRKVETAPAVVAPARNDRSIEVVMVGTPGLSTQLKEILLENIEKLKGENGKEYIQQAEQINKNVATIIDLAKTEIDYLKAIRKHQEHEY